MKLRFRSLTGQTIDVENVNQDGNVLALKQLLESQEAIPAAFQRLIFSGQEMQDHQPLSQYQLQENCIIHLIIRQVPSPQQTQPPQQQYPGMTTISVSGLPEQQAPQFHGSASYYPTSTQPAYTFAPGTAAVHRAQPSPNSIRITVPATELNDASAADIQRLVDTQRYARFTKWFSILDFFLLLLASLGGGPIFLVFILQLFPLSGYIGARNYKFGFIVAVRLDIALGLA